MFTRGRKEQVTADLVSNLCKPKATCNHRQRAVGDRSAESKVVARRLLSVSLRCILQATFRSSGIAALPSLSGRSASVFLIFLLSLLILLFLECEAGAPQRSAFRNATLTSERVGYICSCWSLCSFLEFRAGAESHGVVFCEFLPTADDPFAIDRVDFAEKSATSGLLGAISVDPEPPKISRTMSPRPEQSLIASAIICTGFAVGCWVSSSMRRV